MIIWVVEWRQPSQGDSNSSVWDSEKNARQSACTDILNTISNDWDLNDPDVRSLAKRINDYVSCGDFKYAMNEYNDYQSDRDYEYADYFYVSAQSILDRPATPSLISFTDDDEDEDEDIEDVECEDETYQSSTPGANCRGPCGNRSDYAYADRRDGTHVCYQCKMMSQVFGGTIK